MANSICSPSSRWRRLRLFLCLLLLFLHHTTYPIGLMAVAGGIRAVKFVFDAGTKLYAAYKGRSGGSATDPAQLIFDEITAVHAMRGVTFKDLAESPVSRNLSKEVLNEYMQKFGATTQLGKLSKKDLSAFAQRVGIEPHLVDLMTDPEITLHLQNTLEQTESTTAVSNTLTVIPEQEVTTAYAPFNGIMQLIPGKMDPNRVERAIAGVKGFKWW